MSTSTTKPRDSVVDLLLQLSRDEKVTKAQLNDANTYHSSILAELKSLRDLCEIDPSHDKSNTRTDNESHRELERLRKDNSALKKELDNIQKEKQETTRTNAGHQDNASKQREECEHFKQELQSLRTVHSKTKQELEHYKNKEVAERQAKTDIEKSVSKQREECEHFKQELQSLRTVHSKTKQELEHYKNKEVVERQAKTDFEKSVTKLKEDNESLRHKLEKQRANYNTAKQELEHYKNKERLERKANFDMKHREKEKIVDQQSGNSKQIEKLQDENKTLREETRNMRKQIEELPHRFSTLPGQKMIDGNPDIADLSDPFRPTNLAERFHQLYEDEWTQAFEFLDQTCLMDEPKIINLLANIVKEIDNMCSKTSNNQISKLRLYITDDLVSPKVVTDDGTLVAQTKSAVDEKQEKLVGKLLTEFRKSFGTLSVKPLVELFDKYYMEKMRKPWNIPSSAKELNYFVAKCLEIVWLMKIQHPPMKFLWLYEGEKCDKDRFSFYTKRGEKVKQTVWPAILLHSEGPLVAKGVIQAI